MSHLLKRRRGWYVTVGIAPSIRKILGSKTSHVVRSLQTRDYAQAVSRRKEAVNQIQGELLAIKKAATENGVKAAAEQWKKRIAAKQFDASRFVAEVARVQKSKGDAAAAELSARSFDLYTDLDHMESEWLKNFDAKTVSRYKHSLKLLRGHLTKLELDQSIQAVNAKVALSFARQLGETGVHIRTGKSYLSALRSRWAYWIAQRAIEEVINPWTGVTMPKESSRGSKPKRRPYRDDELVTLFTSAMPQPLFDICAMLVTTGLRRGEPFLIQVKHVTGKWIEVPEGKSASAVRRVPIAKFMQPIWKRILKGRNPDDYLFSEKSEVKAQKPGNLTGQHFLRWRRSIGLDDPATPIHSLRHWFITKAHSLGNPKLNTKSVVGHSTGERDVTDIYTEVDDFAKIQVMESVMNGTTVNVMADGKVKRVFRPGLPAEVRKVIASRFGRAD